MNKWGFSGRVSLNMLMSVFVALGMMKIILIVNRSIAVLVS